MNNPNNRATRAIVASLSLLAIIVFAVPWVDEYLRLRSDAAKLTELEDRFAELRKRNKQLDRIDAKLTSNLEDLSARSIDPTKTEMVREKIVEIVRRAGGRIRRLEIQAGEKRIWAVDGDVAQNSTMPIYGEESKFELHTHTVELQADGSLQSITTILRDVTDQGWLTTTKGLSLTPTTVRESPVRLELQSVLYGLAPREQEQQEEEFAYRPMWKPIR
jgi:hypothetical protein